MSRSAARQQPFHFGYSTNVHRSESLRQIYDFLRRYTLEVKRRVFGAAPSGLELRLGIAVCTARHAGKRARAVPGKGEHIAHA